jgi:hypothetical protein
MSSGWEVFVTSDLAVHWGDLLTPIALQEIGSNSLAHVAIGGALGSVFNQSRAALGIIAAVFCVLLVKDSSLDWTLAEHSVAGFIDIFWDLGCYLFGFIWLVRTYYRGRRDGAAS